MKISKKQLLAEIRTFDANLSEIAKKHAMSYAGVIKRVKSDPDLTAAMHESREALLDVAQAQLGIAVRDGAAWAVKFVLETWGKDRGFTKQIRLETEKEPQAKVVICLPGNNRNPHLSVSR